MATRKQPKQRSERRVRYGTLRVFIRGGRWWARVPGRGRVSLGLLVADVTEEEAYKAAAQEFAGGHGDARASRAAQVDGLAELAVRFSEENAPRWSARHLANVTYRLEAFVGVLATLGVRTNSAITAETLARYVLAEQSRTLSGGGKVSDATINRTIQVARAMARWAAHRVPPLCPEGALAKWKNLREIARNRDPLIPSPREWAAVVRELAREPPKYVRAETIARERANARGVALLVATAVQTGLRIDELRHLRAEDVGDDVVRVRAWGAWRPKDREEREVPVPRSVADLAREFVSWREIARGITDKPIVLGAHWIEQRIAAAWARTKIGGDAPGMHDARRTFATELSRRPGVSVRDVQRLLGHADLETTQRYLGRYRSDGMQSAVDMGIADALCARHEGGV